MLSYRKVFNKLLFPKNYIVLPLVTISAIMLVCTFAGGFEKTKFAYITYAVCAYSFTVLGIKAPLLRHKVKGIKGKNIINKYSKDVRFRIKFTLYGTATLNTLYALFQLDSAVRYNSLWFYSFAGYYALLSTTRVFLLKDTLKDDFGKNRMGELRRYRFCGTILLIISVILAIITVFIVYKNRGFEYSRGLTIAMAGYTLFLVVLAIVNVIRYRKFDSPVMSAAKVVSLTAALTSVLSLETAIINAFGNPNPIIRQLLTGITGVAVFSIILIMASFMIVKSTKEIEKLKK